MYFLRIFYLSAASTNMAQEEPAPPKTLKELVAFSDKEKIPLLIGTNANAHHTV